MLGRRAVFWLVSLWLTAAASAQQHVVLYGDESYPPYSFVENGHFQGMYVDILTKAAERLKPAYTLELVPLPWKRGLADLEFGSAFALFPPGRKRERTYIDHYSTPIYRETVVVFCHADVLRTARKSFPQDYAGLTIGVNLGFLLSDRLMQASRQGVVKLEAAKSNEANLKKLAGHRIDCYASDRAAARYSARQLQHYFASAGFQLVEAVELSGEDTFIGYSGRNKPPYKADFIAQMDAALEAMKKNGDMARIVGEYLR